MPQRSDRMRILLCIGGMVVLCLSSQSCLPLSDRSVSSLCSLQKRLAQGARENVVVSGVYHQGLESRFLSDSGCPEGMTWVDFDLHTTANKTTLQTSLGELRQAAVVFEGEFYGPRPAHPSLPEALRKTSHPRWGHLGCCETRIVVHAIREVKAVPIR